MIRRSVLAGALAAAVVACGPSAPPDRLTVLAAASLSDALEAIGEDYQRLTGREVVFSFAASSTLARQIEAGADAAIFASADERWMDHLAMRGVIETDTRTSPISNSLVLIAPADAPADATTVDADINLAALLGEEGRLAVGDPDHVPAGRYAREALEALGLWEEAQPRLARALDVRAALALVARGEARLGVVYATDAAISDRVRVIGVFPASSHAPIRYPFAIVAGARSEPAERFMAYVAGEAGLATFERFGFTVRSRDK